MYTSLDSILAAQIVQERMATAAGARQARDARRARRSSRGPRPGWGIMRRAKAADPLPPTVVASLGARTQP
jgi:hypothetical protein